MLKLTSFLTAFSFLAVMPSVFAVTKELTFSPEQSKVEWVGSKIIGSEHNGTLSIKQATMKVENGMPKTAKIVVDMTSIKNLDLKDKKYNDKLVNHLKSDDFFGTKKFKESTLIISKIQKVNDSKWRLDGKLTIKNKTKDVSFIANSTLNGKKLKAVKVDFEFDRTDFDIRYGSGKFFDNLGDKMISDKVQVKVMLMLENPVELS